MRIKTFTAMSAGLLALGLVGGCSSETVSAATTSKAATSPAAPFITTQPAQGSTGLTEDEQFEWALDAVDAEHPGGAESIRLGRGVCQQFDKVQSYTYGSLWLVKNSDGFVTKVDQVSDLMVAAVEDDPGLTVDRDGKVSVDTGDSIGDLLLD